MVFGFGDNLFDLSLGKFCFTGDFQGTLFKAGFQQKVTILFGESEG